MYVYIYIYIYNLFNIPHSPAAPLPQPPSSPTRPRPDALPPTKHLPNIFWQLPSTRMSYNFSFLPERLVQLHKRLSKRHVNRMIKKHLCGLSAQS